MNKKKKLIVMGMLVCAICFATAAIGINKGADVLDANAEYVTDDDYDEIMPHDGDVLVDSLKLTKLPSDGQVSGNEPTNLVTSDDISELKNSDTYFEEVRATINMDRNQIISMLSDVISETENTSEKENATTQKLKIIDYMEKEKTTESLIQTKGLPECIVLITDNAVNVTVDKQELTQSDVAKICDIIMRETGRAASQIVIQSKY